MKYIFDSLVEEEHVILKELILERLNNKGNEIEKIDRTKTDILELIGKLRYKAVIDLGSNVIFTSKLFMALSEEDLEVDKDKYEAFRLNEFIKEYLFNKDPEGNIYTNKRKKEDFEKKLFEEVQPKYDSLSAQGKEEFKTKNEYILNGDIVNIYDPVLVTHAAIVTDLCK